MITIEKIHNNSDFVITNAGFTKPNEFVDFDGATIKKGVPYHIHYTNDKQVDRQPLGSWNWPSRNFTNWMVDKGYTAKSVRLSPVYRANKYLIEGERGFIWTQEDEARIIHNLSQYYTLN